MHLSYENTLGGSIVQLQVKVKPPFLSLTLANVGALLLTTKLPLSMTNYFSCMLRASFIKT